MLFLATPAGAGAFLARHPCHCDDMLPSMTDNPTERPGR